MDTRRVQMVALWSFAGPEGATGNRSVGRVRQGKEFIATEQRARHLESRGKAKRLGTVRLEYVRDDEPRPSEQPQAGPSETKQERPPAREVLAQVDSGQMTANQALEDEEASEEPRSTLIRALKQRQEAGG